MAPRSSVRVAFLRDRLGWADRVAGMPGDHPAWRAERERASGGDPTPWERGAEGERLFAAAVHHGLPDWTALHSLPKRGSRGDIDHVLIGPGGVYTVNTKHLSHDVRLLVPDRLLFTINDDDMIAQARAEAAHAHAMLSINYRRPFTVDPVVVIVGADVEYVRVPETRDTEPFPVLPLPQAVDWFKSRPSTLDPHAVEELSFWASLHAVWMGHRFGL